MIKDLINNSRKALVPVVVAGVLTVAGYVGITGEMSVKEAVTLVVTGVIVWFTRNR